MMSLVVPDFEASFLGVVPYRQGHTGWELGGHSAGRAIIIWLAIIHPITVSLVTASSWLTGGLAALLFIVLPYGLHGEWHSSATAALPRYPPAYISLSSTFCCPRCKALPVRPLKMPPLRCRLPVLHVFPGLAHPGRVLP